MDIGRREADLAVRANLTRPAQYGVVCRKLCDIGFGLYASHDYLLRAGTPVRGKGLAGHNVIRFLGAPRAIGESLEGARTVLRCNDQFVQLKAAAHGQGIVEMACYSGDSFPGIRRIWPNSPPVLKALWLLCHEDTHRATRIRILSSAIVDLFQRNSKVLRSGLRARNLPGDP